MKLTWAGMKKKFKMERSLFQTIMRFLFSHLGLCIVIIIYSCLGALMYHKLEYPEELERTEQYVNQSHGLAQKKERIRDLLVKWKWEQEEERLMRVQQEIYDSKLHPNHRSPPESIIYYMEGLRYKEETIMKAIKELVDDYHRNLSGLMYAVKDDKGSVDSMTEYQWTFASSLVFAVSAITLIGYGHISPTLEMTKFVTIPYCLFGVPLLLIFLSNIGRAMARMIRFGYRRTCCYICTKKRDKACEDRNLGDDAKIVSMTSGLAISAEIGWNNEEEPSDVLQDADQPVPVVLTAGILIGYISFGAFVYFLWEKWAFVSSVYCAFTTLTTIGFGDYVPGFTTLESASGKWKLVFGSVYIISGLAVVSMGLDLMIEEVMVSIRRAAIFFGVVEFVDEDGDGIDDKEQERMKRMNNLEKAARGRIGCG